VPASSLTKDDFQLFEDGRPREITTFSSVNDTLASIGLLFETQPLMLMGSANVLRDIAAFGASLPQGDRVLVGNARRRGLSGPSASQQAAGLSPDFQPFAAFPSIWEGVNDAIASLAVEASRKILVIVPGYWVVDPPTNQRLPLSVDTPAPASAAGPPRVSQKGKPEVEQRLARGDLIVYGLVLDGVVYDQGLKSVAEATGGSIFHVHRGDDALRLGLDRIRTDLESLYLLGFTPASADGKSHRISVTSASSGAQLQSRTAYIADGKAMVPISVTPRPTTPESGTASQTINVLDRYAAGDRSGAMAAITSELGLARFADDLQVAGRHWVTSGPGASPHEARRRLTAAVFALDLASLTINASTPDASVDRVSCARLIVWAARLEPASVDWYLVAATMLQSLGIGLVGDDLPPLLSTALRLFPQEPRVLLAQAEVEERLGAPVQVTAVTIQEFASNQLASLAATDPSSPLRALQGQPALLEAAAKHYEELTRFSVVAAEAHLRLGFLRLKQRRRTEARAHLAEADRLTADPGFRYLSRLFQGWTYERDDQLADAEAAYRSALEVRPHVRSASTLLAAVLASSGRVNEASRVLADGMIARPIADDPWESFVRTSRERLAEMLDALRRSLK
jgi:tetratricopeptide (TPR) repeat protein